VRSSRGTDYGWGQFLKGKLGQENIMGPKVKVGACALLMSLLTIGQAFAGLLPTVTPAVPEFDGPSATAAIALLASIGAVFFSRSRNS
jgi:hypothetical protein